MNDSVQDLWKKKVWPCRGGVFFSDETVSLMTVLMPWETDGQTVNVSFLERVRLEDLKEVREGKTTHLYVTSTSDRSYAELNVTVYAGEGAHGSEGFIALECMETGKLRWLVYFECSNPFETALLENGNVIAVSSLGYIWNLPINQPQLMTVELGAK